MRKNKIGKIDISALNVPPEKHEFETAKYYFRKAMRQSSNVIFDLCRLKPKSERDCLKVLRMESKTHKVNTLIIITRDGRMLTIKGVFDIITV